MALYDIGKVDKNGKPVLLNKDAYTFSEWCEEAGVSKATGRDLLAWKEGQAPKMYERQT